uniref:Nuclear receptor domain-containing protein n=1 Tax=Panagrolaimus sp. JU765 TaxID=591449 RepID=A0AC34RG83_9BILA
MSEESCCVCGSLAEGVRFGAQTCQACAAFFRRSIAENKIYKCSNSSKCEVLRQRNHCRACRLEKCFKVGMKRELVNDVKPNLPDFSAQMPSTSDNLAKLGCCYSTFFQAQKSLFKLHFLNSKDQLLMSEIEFRQVSSAQHNVMEQGNASLIANFLLECFPTFKDLPTDDKHKFFGPVAVRFNHIHRCLLTIRFLSDPSDIRVAIHYGFHSSVNTLESLYGEDCDIPEIRSDPSDIRVAIHYGFHSSVNTLESLYGEDCDIPEIRRLIGPVFRMMRHLASKLQNLELSEAEIGGIIALMFYSQMEKHGFLSTQAEDARNEIFAELHQESIKKRGFANGGIRFGIISAFTFDVEVLQDIWNSVRTLRRFVMKGGAEIFMLADDLDLK